MKQTLKAHSYKMLQSLRLEGPLLHWSSFLCSIYFICIPSGNDLLFCTKACVCSACCMYSILKRRKIKW